MQCPPGSVESWGGPDRGGQERMECDTPCSLPWQTRCLTGTVHASACQQCVDTNEYQVLRAYSGTGVAGNRNNNTSVCCADTLNK